MTLTVLFHLKFICATIIARLGLLIKLLSTIMQVLEEDQIINGSIQTPQQKGGDIWLVRIGLFLYLLHEKSKQLAN